MRVHEQVRTHVVGGLLRHRRQELLELRLRVAPREVAVALLEAHGRERAHDRRACERLSQEDDVGVGRIHLGDEPLPELERLGVRVVDAEDLHALLNPVPHDAQHLGVDARGIIVEVERVDVLVLLRRVLGVGDRPVGEGREPLRMLLHPRVVGRGLQREIESDFQALLPGCTHEGAEILGRAEVRMDGVVSALRCADRVRGARVSRFGREGVVAALAVGRADRMDGDQVDDVEPHGCDLGQPSCRRTERTAPDRTVLEASGALGAREELVPGADTRGAPVDVQHLGECDGAQRRDRTLSEDLCELCIRRKGDGRRGISVAEREGISGQSSPLRCRTVLLSGGGGEEIGAERRHDRDVDAGRHLQRGGVGPGREVVGEGFEPVAPGALLVERDLRHPRVGAVIARREAMQALFAGGRCEADMHADDVVPLSERDHPERDDLADEGLRSEPARDGGRRFEERDARRPQRAGSICSARGARRDLNGAPKSRGPSTSTSSHLPNVPRGRGGG